MPYQFATDDQDYSDYASGRVIYALPGAPAFPVRLASEIFQRALRHLPPGKVTIYDPTCGAAYHLTALGFLHGEHIRAIYASEVEVRALTTAGRNLGLLSPGGLARRAEELTRLETQFGKESHAQALRSLETIRRQVEGRTAIVTGTFLANALDRAAIQHGLDGNAVDLVFSDIPYGQHSQWQLPENAPPGNPSPVWLLLDALLGIIRSGKLVVIAADKAQKIAHEGYRRVEHFQVGKRQVFLLEAI